MSLSTTFPAGLFWEASSSIVAGTPITQEDLLLQNKFTFICRQNVSNDAVYVQT